VAGTQLEKIDGRRARGIRTKDAIVGALLELIGAGDVSPTAQRIADRANVSVRSVYQHFADVEGLYADAAARTYQWARESAKAIALSLPATKRVDAFVDDRATMLETLMSFNRAARLIEPSSDRVRGYRVELERWEKDRVGKVFGPELKAMEASRRSAVHGGIDAVTSTDSWDYLRRNGQTIRGARHVLRTTVSSLLSSS
jgi:AcrR family transcriptional regulator